MRIHQLELRNVRQFRKLVLDLTAPLTVIGGPQGVGKTTLQKALLAAMFQVKKEERDALRSRFDLDSPPTAIVTLSSDSNPGLITLSRRLTDDTGEWREGATVIRQKGKALEKVQGALPISAQAASHLLWGLQEEMAAVVENFPADGHTLLTAASIRGAGPDPKQAAAELDKDSKAAKRSGKDPGALTRAEAGINHLEQELEKAKGAQGQLASLTQQFETAKNAAQQARNDREALEQEGKQLADLEKMLDVAMKALKKLSDLDNKRDGWDNLEEEMEKAQDALRDLQEELVALEVQYRVGRDQELTAKIASLTEQIKRVEDVQRKQEALQQKVESRARPDQADLINLEALKKVIDENCARMEATGVRYELQVESVTRQIQISEDNAPTKTLELRPGQTETGVVGTVRIVADSLRLVASGKEDIPALKRAAKRTETSIADLFERFGVPDESTFRLVQKERMDLEAKLKDAKYEVRLELKGATSASLESDLKLAEQERADLRLTQTEKDTLAGRVLRSVAEIKTDLSGKRGEIKNAEGALKSLRAKQPTADQRARLDADLLEAQKHWRGADGAFKEADKKHREPSDTLLEETRAGLGKKRDEFKVLLKAEGDAEKELVRLRGDLKHAGPERPIPAIEADLEEAKAILHREEILQEAREVLKERIEAKIVELTEQVPRELGEKVSNYLVRLTKGAYGKASLNEGLTLSKVQDGGATPERWEPHELSHGERHQAALAIKVAVARALADSSGPVFIVLDDSLVHFDPERRAAAEELLSELPADGKLQVIFLTCHTDWAEDWKRRQPKGLNYIELSKVADYYRPPAALVTH